MQYIALTFWMLTIVLASWGVHQLWSGMIRAKVLNTILLPGTFVAQVGHVLGLLVTGATISNTTLFKDDESGAPETTPDPKPRIPVIGPVIIAMLPLLACGTAVFLLARQLGRSIVAAMPTGIVGPRLPTSLAGFWQTLHDQLTLAEAGVAAATSADFGSWKTWLFLYLMICLTVRMAPFPGTLRGSLGAILVLGIGGATISSLFDVADPRVQTGWAVMSLTVATLVLLLMMSLAVRGGVGLTRILRESA